MAGCPPRDRARAAGLALLLLALGAPVTGHSASPVRSTTPARSATPPARSATPAPEQPPTPPTDTPTPRAYLIYLADGAEPIVVKRYVEEEGEIRFEKYGGWVGIPKYEILRIVPDQPATESSGDLPTIGAPVESASAAVTVPKAPGDPPEPLPATPGDLFLSLRSGGELKVQGLTPEGERVRVVVPDGSFTVERSDIVGIVRVPRGVDTPEAWLVLVSTGPPGRLRPATVNAALPPTSQGSQPGGAPDGMGAGPPPPGSSRPGEPPAGSGAESARPFSLPYPSSDRPHLVRLANGQVMRVDGFQAEDGQLRFSRFGGMVGIALAEVARLVPEEIAPVAGRTSARFVAQLGPDLLEVRLPGAAQRIRLLGVTPAGGADLPESPWHKLQQGMVVHLEFDRQRFDPEGNWLAYVFLPGNRMLNAELVRLGLARPHADGRNVRYLDLFEELSTAAARPDETATPEEPAD